MFLITGTQAGCLRRPIKMISLAAFADIFGLTGPAWPNSNYVGASYSLQTSTMSVLHNFCASLAALMEVLAFCQVRRFLYLAGSEIFTVE